MAKFGVGQSVKRKEDNDLLRGVGEFQDDLNLPGQAHAHFLRSQHAHADIEGIDYAAALAMPGVVAIYTGADVEALPVDDRRLRALQDAKRLGTLLLNGDLTVGDVGSRRQVCGPRLTRRSECKNQEPEAH